MSTNTTVVEFEDFNGYKHFRLKPPFSHGLSHGQYVFFEGGKHVVETGWMLCSRFPGNRNRLEEKVLLRVPDSAEFTLAPLEQVEVLQAA